MFLLFFFFFNDTATTEIYTLSLHDALPISLEPDDGVIGRAGREPVHFVIELGRAPLGETAERVEGHRVGPGGPHEPRALTAEHEVARREARAIQHADGDGVARHEVARVAAPFFDQERSEEHTSELQSPCNLVCRLLLEKKKEPRY